MLHSGREDGLGGDPAGHGILKPPARFSPPHLLFFCLLPALKATQTELLELRCKYDEEAASK